MIEAIQTNARKFAAFFSERVATRRYCLALDQNRSHRFRSRYVCRSYPRGTLRFDLGGITASAPRASIAPTKASLSYPRSAMTTSGSWPPSSPSACPMSDAWPGVSVSSTGRPRPLKLP